ncbi:flagellar basal body P-ring formation chaperone FlgA [Acidihalobacter ferrooxydans]|uniref:Flagella basal body P-ring formation protein FlgA n=1 Tax=Acidihalobacter ferrooxydans TaxID=1765967 RepID=A0A1P8UGQ8_9GAMM|nr:flagellar basal body P-ring formation chaperone FlgA [Acidihalobacter ferrooxydans]APZ43033.1 flagella basal body P-ring formation protein FlgA [Acidihalobacter ferrooxydans]
MESSPAGETEAGTRFAFYANNGKFEYIKLMHDDLLTAAVDSRIKRALMAACLLVLLPQPMLTAQAARSIESPEALRQAAVDYALGQAKRRLPEARLSAKAAPLDSRLRMTACKTPLKTQSAAGAARVGNTVVAVQCMSPRWKLYVPVRVDAYIEVVVAARPLLRGTHVAGGQLTHAERNAASLPYGYFTQASEVVGQVLTRNLAPGAVLTPQGLRPPMLVKRGQIVSVTAGSGGLSVSTHGEALQNGARGALIRVRNLQSNRIVQGRVTSVGTVHVGG